MDNFRFIYNSHENIVYGEVKNQRLISYYDEIFTLKGNIYRGKILNYIKSMDAFIVDIGLNKNGLLRTSNTIYELKPSMDVIVELTKVSTDDKLYELTQNYSLTDGYIVYLPFNKSRSKKILKEHNKSYILRSKAKDINHEEIRKRLNKLDLIHIDLLKEKNELPTPKLLVESNFKNEFINDYEYEIISNTKIDKIIYDKDFNPNYHPLLARELIKMKSRSVDVDGVEIVIDRLEALTVIDVNSKNMFMDLDKDEMSLRINQLALEEIAIQLGVRNIKKMVIIDFLRINEDMKKNFLKNISEVFKSYNLKFKLLGYSNLNFVEIIMF